MKKYNFDIHFQRNLLCLMFRKPGFITRYRDTLEPVFFSKQLHSDLAESILQLTEKFGQPITSQMLVQEADNRLIAKGLKQTEFLRQLDLHKGEIDRIASIDSSTEGEYTRDLLVKFARRQAMNAFVIDAANKLASARVEQTDFEQMEQDVASVLRIGEELDDLGISYFEEPSKRILHHQQMREHRILTMIKGIDEHTQGIGAGETGVILGFKGRGKTALLVNFGVGAILQGKRVVYYTLGDQPEHYIAARFDGRLSGFPVNELFHYHSALVDKLESVHQMTRGDLIIKEFPPGQATARTFEAHLDSLEGLDFRPDLVIVDYADNMTSSKHYDSDWQEHQAAYTELVALGVTLKLPIWTGSQVKQASENKVFPSTSDAAYSFGKLDGVHVVLSLAQTPEEKDRKEMRVCCPHQRNGPSNWSVHLGLDLDMMLMFWEENKNNEEK